MVRFIKLAKMKSITIHNLDTAIAQKIQQMANEMGLSQNKLIKRLLRQSLGLSDTPAEMNNFEKFCGCWSEQEAKEFTTNTSTFDAIDTELWD
jgi:hypothetical protein